MNKILRYSFLAVLAMVVGNTYANDVTWDLSVASYDDGASADKVTWSSDYVIFTLDKNGSSTDANNYLAGGNPAHTRFYKKQKLTFKPVSGYAITSIEITATASGNYTNYFVNATWTNGEAEASDKVITVTTENGALPVSAVINDATRATQIKVSYIASGGSQVDANLSFSPTSLKVRLGKPFTAPTLVNEKSAPVVSSSSNDEVAEVNAETGAVTLKAAGEATITAAVPESNTSYYGSASYTLTVEELVTINTFPFSETFANTFGKFLVEDKSLAEGLSFVWSKNSGYVKASAYANKKDNAAESWLVSPLFDLTNASAPNMLFEHAVNYFTDLAAAKQEATVWVREGDEGEWTKLEIAYPEELGWTFVSSGSIDLSAYVGKTIQIGFKYTSDAKAGTWEIKNFKVIDGQDAGLAFSKDKVSIVLGTENPEYPTLTNPHNLTVVYSSSNTDAAEIDAETGAITLKADGKTTIKATFAGNDEYLAGEASYELTVIDDNVKGRKGNPYTIAEIQAIEETAYPTDKVWVIGYIAGCAANGGVISKDDPVDSNILLTATATFDETDVLLPVGIPNNASRTAINIKDNPTNVGKEVKVYGKVQKYFGVNGVKEVTSHEFTGQSVDIVVTGITNINAAKAENAVRYNLAGQKVNNDYKGVVIMNGKKFMNK